MLDVYHGHLWETTEGAVRWRDKGIGCAETELGVSGKGKDPGKVVRSARQEGWVNAQSWLEEDYGFSSLQRSVCVAHMSILRVSLGITLVVKDALQPVKGIDKSGRHRFLIALKLPLPYLGSRDQDNLVSHSYLLLTPYTMWSPSLCLVHASSFK